MTGRILLTGFEPFGKWDVNPTAEACKELDGKVYADMSIVARVLPLRFSDIRKSLHELMQTVEPKAIVMSGQAGGDKIRLERVAVNIAESKAPYNCGTVTSGQLLVADGSDTLESTLPLERYLSALEDEEVPVRYSDSAGKFGCNQVFYYSRNDFPEIPSGFIHVPLLPSQNGKYEMSQEQITLSLELICRETISWLKK